MSYPDDRANNQAFMTRPFMELSPDVRASPVRQHFRICMYACPQVREIALERHLCLHFMRQFLGISRVPISRSVRLSGLAPRLFAAMTLWRQMRKARPGPRKRQN